MSGKPISIAVIFRTTEMTTFVHKQNIITHKRNDLQGMWKPQPRSAVTPYFMNTINMKNIIINTYIAAMSKQIIILNFLQLMIEADAKIVHISFDGFE